MTKALTCLISYLNSHVGASYDGQKGQIGLEKKTNSTFALDSGEQEKSYPRSAS